MAVYNYEKKLFEEKEELIMKKMEKNGLVVDNVLVLNQDYDFIKDGCVIRAEKGSIGIIRSITIDSFDKNENAKCTLSMYFYASDYYLSLNFSTTENNDNKIVIESNEINIKDLFTVLDESNEITQAVKQYEELETAFNIASSRFYNSINLWKVLRVLWIGAIIFSCVFIAMFIIQNIESILWEMFLTLVIVAIALIAIVVIFEITDVFYSDTHIGKKKEKELENALEIIEKLDEKSCG